MGFLLNFLPGYKSHLSAAGIVLTGILGFISGDFTLAESALMVFNGAGISGLRIAIATKGVK